ncbi:MAG: hypothetical protein ACLSB9_20645 [Hydrogeniiclostridium mannosilyticum]
MAVSLANFVDAAFLTVLPVIRWVPLAYGEPRWFGVDTSRILTRQGVWVSIFGIGCQSTTFQGGV